MPLVNCLVNGQPQMHLNIEDRALHYGDGLFETMLYHGGKIALWHQHFSRLKNGCSVLDIQLVEEAVLLNDLKELTKNLTNESYLIKLIISRGAAGRGIIVDKHAAVSRLFLAYNYQIKERQSQRPKMLKVCKTSLLINKHLGGVKHLNRLLYVLAANELDDAFFEGIMLNQRKEMIECITHNLFFVKKNILYTAPINDCGVAGIKRQQVIDKAKELGLDVQIKAFLTNDLKQMDECFITNAVIGVQSIDGIEKIPFIKNTMTHQLQKALNVEKK